MPGSWGGGNPRDYFINISLGEATTDETGGFTSKGEDIQDTQKLLAHSSINEPPYPFPSASETMSLSSTSDNDIMTGSGTWLVQASTLDANFNTQNEVVALTGKTPVILSGTATRAVNLLMLAAGFSNAGDGKGRFLPDGTIYLGYGTVTDGVPQYPLASINNNDTVSFLPVFTIPDGFVAPTTSLFFTGSPEHIIEVTFGARFFGINNIFFSAAYPVNGQLNVLPQLPAPALPPRTDLMFFAVRKDLGRLPPLNNASTQAQLNFILRGV